MNTLFIQNLADAVNRAITVFAFYKEPLIKRSYWIKISSGGAFLPDESSSHQGVKGVKVLQKVKKLFIQYVGIPAGKSPVDKYGVSASLPIKKKASHIKRLSPVVLILFLTLSGCGGTGEEAAGNRAYTPAAYGSVTFKWEAPTTTVNGDPLNNLENYKLYYGTSSGVYTDSVDVGTNQFGYPVCVDIGGGVTECTYTLTDVPVDTYYFTVTAYDTNGSESSYSNEDAGTPA